MRTAPTRGGLFEIWPHAVDNVESRGIEDEVKSRFNDGVRLNELHLNRGTRARRVSNLKRDDSPPMRERDQISDPVRRTGYLRLHGVVGYELPRGICQSTQGYMGHQTKRQTYNKVQKPASRAVPRHSPCSLHYTATAALALVVAVVAVRFFAAAGAALMPLTTLGLTFSLFSIAFCVGLRARPLGFTGLPNTSSGFR